MNYFIENNEFEMPDTSNFPDTQLFTVSAKNSLSGTQGSFQEKLKKCTTINQMHRLIFFYFSLKRYYTATGKYI